MVAILLPLLVILSAPARAVDSVRDNLYGVSFVNHEDGWVCGSFGAMAHTTDGGKTWKTQRSGVSEQLFSVDFVDEQNGWAVGRSGTIVHTTDGGLNWQSQQSPNKKHLFSVDFVDDAFGIAVGDWGVVLVTEDGGQNWIDRSLSEDLILNEVAAVNRQTIFLAGEIGSLLRSDDGGLTWNRLESGIDKTLFGVTCRDTQHCWAVGIDAIILKTDDGGATWAVRNGSTEMRPLEQVGFGQAFENPSLYSIGVTGDFAVAAGEIGSVFVSRDAGDSWQRLEASKNWALPWFGDVVVLDGEDGAIVGARGRRIMIVDGRIELAEEGD